MVWVVVAVALGVTLVLAVTWLAALVLRLRTQVALLEDRTPAARAPGETGVRPDGGVAVPVTAPHDDRPEYVITRIGQPEPEPAPTEVARVDAAMFTDIVLKETVVQAASLAHGLRRALAPETRNRIRFHMRAEAKRSRKQRRAELRDVRREWAARQRSQMAAAGSEDSAA